MFLAICTAACIYFVKEQRWLPPPPKLMAAPKSPQRSPQGSPSLRQSPRGSPTQRLRQQSQRDSSPRGSGDQTPRDGSPRLIQPQRQVSPRLRTSVEQAPLLLPSSEQSSREGRWVECGWPSK